MAPEVLRGVGRGRGRHKPQPRWTVKELLVEGAEEEFLHYQPTIWYYICKLEYPTGMVEEGEGHKNSHQENEASPMVCIHEYTYSIFYGKKHAALPYVEWQLRFIVNESFNVGLEWKKERQNQDAKITFHGEHLVGN